MAESGCLPEDTPEQLSREIRKRPLTIKEIKAYDTSALEQQVPQGQSGTVTVAQGRAGPFNLHYEKFGNGPIKLLWIAGQGGGYEFWYDYVKEFGLDQSEKYTSILFENRGIGRSHLVSWSFYKMEDMARDALELLDHLGWHKPKSVHVVGHSMGGMIAMVMARLEATRIASLTLVSTTSHWVANLDVWAMLKTCCFGVVPKTADGELNVVKGNLFGTTWLNQPDEKAIFPTNGDNWAARYLSFVPQYKASMLQLPACGLHRVTANDLSIIANNVGGTKIQIIHGKADNVLVYTAAERTYRGLGGEAAGVKLHLYDTTGHMAILENRFEIIKLVHEMVDVKS